MIASSSTIKNIGRKPLVIALKVAMLILLGWILYIQIFEKNEIEDLVQHFAQRLQQKGNVSFFLLAIILMPLNWCLEAKKWQILIRNFQNFTFRLALKSILSGVSLAIMTPGRIGEYGGRLIGIESPHRHKAILANFISSISQNIINLGIGLLGSLFFLQKFMPVHYTIILALIFISAMVITTMLVLYFRIDLLGGILAYLPQWKWVKKVRSDVEAFSQSTHSNLLSILGMSALRYVIYLTQYVLLLLFFGITEDVVSAVLGVTTIFFFQSNLPLPPALSVLARGEMAIFLWSVFTNNVLGIIAASFLLWLINLVIPAILGTLIITQSKIFEE